MSRAIRSTLVSRIRDRPPTDGSALRLMTAGGEVLKNQSTGRSSTSAIATNSVAPNLRAPFSILLMTVRSTWILLATSSCVSAAKARASATRAPNSRSSLSSPMVRFSHIWGSTATRTPACRLQVCFGKLHRRRRQAWHKGLALRRSARVEALFEAGASTWRSGRFGPGPGSGSSRRRRSRPRPPAG